MMKKKFRIAIDCDVELDTSAIWSNGDAPENPTAKDVLAVIKATSHSLTDFINSWSLDEDIEAFVIDDETNTSECVDW